MIRELLFHFQIRGLMRVNKVKAKGKRASNNDYFLLYRAVEIKKLYFLLNVLESENSHET